jgi:HK97 family phage prohead protease
MKKLKYNSLGTFKVNAEETTAEDLIIEGYVTRYNVVNSYGDMLAPGCATKTLNEWANKTPFLYYHNMANPIGKLINAEDRPEGIWIKVKISNSEDDIQTKIREEILNDLSLGWYSLNGKVVNVDNEQVWLETEIKIAEYSLVTKGAMPGANIISLNADDIDKYVQVLNEAIDIIKDKKLNFQLTQLRDAIATQPTEEVTEPVDVEAEKVNTIDYQAIINRLKFL